MRKVKWGRRLNLIQKVKSTQKKGEKKVGVEVKGD